MENLSYSAIVLTGVRAVGVLLQIGLTLALARVLSVNDMGVYAVVYAILTLARFLGPAGVDQLTLRFIPQAMQGKQESNLDEIDTFSVASLVYIGCISTLFALSGACFYLIWYEEPLLTFIEVVAVAGGLITFPLIGLLVAQVRAFGRNIAAQIPDAIGIHLMFGAVLFVCYLAGELSRGQVIPALTLASLGVVLMLAALRWSCGWKTVSPNATVFRSIVRDGFQIWKALIVTGVNARAPVFFATLFLGTAATALMDIAIRFGTLAVLITSSVGTTLSPNFARLAGAGNDEAVARGLRTGSLLAGVPALLCLLGLLVAGRWIIDLTLPDDYQDAFWPLVIVAAATAVNAFFGLASNFLLMSGRESVVSRFSLLGLLASFLIAFTFAPMFGTIAIACGYLASAIIRDVGLMVLVFRNYLFRAV